MATKYFFKRRFAAAMLPGVVFLLLCQLNAGAQQKPPRPMVVTFNPGQGLRFGAFFQSSSGGSVIISTADVRTFTGAVVGASLGVACGAADFEIDADPGTLVNIVNGPDATLYGSSGGTMTLHLGGSYPSALPYVTTASSPATTSVRIGGTLTVGSPVANPSGTYSGSFVVMFVQE